MGPTEHFWRILISNLSCDRRLTRASYCYPSTWMGTSFLWGRDSAGIRRHDGLGPCLSRASKGNLDSRDLGIFRWEIIYPLLLSALLLSRACKAFFCLRGRDFESDWSGVVETRTIAQDITCAP